MFLDQLDMRKSGLESNKQKKKKKKKKKRNSLRHLIDPYTLSSSIGGGTETKFGTTGFQLISPMVLAYFFLIDVG